jgi:hypothetical protein
MTESKTWLWRMPAAELDALERLAVELNTTRTKLMPLVVAQGMAGLKAAHRSKVYHPDAEAGERRPCKCCKTEFADPNPRREHCWSCSALNEKLRSERSASIEASGDKGTCCVLPSFTQVAQSLPLHQTTHADPENVGLSPTKCEKTADSGPVSRFSADPEAEDPEYEALLAAFGDSLS